MKKVLLILNCLILSLSAQSQGFDPNSQNIFYTISGPSVVQAELVAGVWQDVATFPMTRFNNAGSVNGLGCNPLDSCLYYINNSAGSCHLYKMDASGTCTLISSGMSYTVNGGVDACGNYLQYSGTTITKTNLQTLTPTTVTVPNLGFITDIDYNPFSCNYFNCLYNQGNMLEVDASGVLLQTITSPQPGTTQVGGMALNPDGTQVYLSKGPNIYAYDIVSGGFVSQTPLSVAAAGAPIADLATFQYDNVVADITNNGPDTLTFITCDDSVTVNFNNYSTGDINDELWDFGDGTTSMLNTPIKKFESDNIYEVVYRAVTFTCETCQVDDDNYDTLWVEIIPDTLETVLSKTDPTCVTSQDGDADVISITGGTAPYSYLWTNSGNTNQQETGLDAGWVYVEVTGVNGCQNTDSIFLVNPQAVEVNLATSDAICFQSNDGTAGAVPVNPPVTYTYTWSSSANTTANELNIPAGAQSVVVTDLAGCDTTYLFTILEPTEVTVNPQADTIICIGGSAILNALAAGGSGGYSIDWVGIGTGSQNVSPAVNTCYDVQATDVNGCVSQIDQICVSLHSPLNVSVAGSDVCPGVDALLTSNSSGGFGAYSYTWDIAGAASGTNASFQHSPATSTTYCLTLDDACETPAVSDCITINVFTEPQLALTPQSICEGETVSFPDPAINPSQISSYNWEFGDGSSSYGNAPSNAYDYAGFYTVTVNIVSTNNCNFQTTFTDLVEVNAVPGVSFQYNPQVVTIEDTEVDFFNSSTDATSYVWDFGDGSATSNEESPSHIFPPIAGTAYTVTLDAYNGVCHNSIEQIVMVEDIIIYYIPNAFTPDGDHHNEEFKPIVTSGVDIYDYHFTIFNRWGEIVFESYNAAFGWNGHYGTGGLVEDGTYVWTLEFGETMSDKQHKNSGHVTVLK